MKIEINESTPLSFPKLMKFNGDHSFIILADLSAKKETIKGVVLSSDKESYVVGKHYDGFLTDKFEDFYGEIILNQ